MSEAKGEKMKSKITNIIFWIITITAMVYTFNFYKKNNFNDFIRCEMNIRTSQLKKIQK